MCVDQKKFSAKFSFLITGPINLEEISSSNVFKKSTVQVLIIMFHCLQ